MRNLILALVFGLAFVINPAYVTGCDTIEDEPDFGEAEMVALLSDLNAMGVSEVESGDARYEVELTLAQAEGDDVLESRAPTPFASTAYACGNRTFMKSAAACVTVTHMGVEGTLTVRRAEGDDAGAVVETLEVTGLMRAWGEQLRSVDVEVQLDGGGYATWSTQNAKDFELTAFDADDLGEDGVDIHLM